MLLFSGSPTNAVQLLPSSVTAVDAEIGASHEGACVAEEEDGGAAILVRHADAAKHVLSSPLGLALGVIVKEVLEHLGQDVAGGEGVDADAILAPFSSEIAPQLHYSSLGWVVNPSECVSG